MTGPERFALLTPEQLDALPDPQWLIRGYLPLRALVVLYGPPGGGKTFVVLGMALSIAAGNNFAAVPTRRGKVLYVAAEGLHGLKKRARAYCQLHDLGTPEIRYCATPMSLLETGDIGDLLAAMRGSDFQPDLIILDTFARVLGGADENSSSDVGQAVRGADALKDATGATVLLVHHTGKSRESERGSSALRAAVDVMICCTSKQTDWTVLNGIPIRCEKMKDAEPFPDALLAVTKVELGFGLSSLAVGAFAQLNEAAIQNKAVDTLVEIANTFGPNGAAHAQLKTEFIRVTGGSKSKFDRALKEAGKVLIKQGQGPTTRYIASGLSPTSVSRQSHETDQVGIISPPLLGGETDTDPETRAEPTSRPLVLEVAQ